MYVCMYVCTYMTCEVLVINVSGTRKQLQFGNKAKWLGAQNAIPLLMQNIVLFQRCLQAMLRSFMLLTILTHCQFLQIEIHLIYLLLFIYFIIYHYAFTKKYRAVMQIVGDQSNTEEFLIKKLLYSFINIMLLNNLIPQY